MVRLGFIGLGIMGKPMTMNLLKQGYETTVFDINELVVKQLVEEGARGAGSAKEVAEHSDIIFTMVPNSAHVKSVILDKDGVINGAKDGDIVVDLSSISPDISKDIAARLAEHGVHMLDAPVSGGEQGAFDATLAIMVGGKEEIFQKVKPILACMGKDITLVGDHGSGTTAKLANQIIVNVNIAAMAEALAFATKAGIDVGKMYEAIRGGLAGSAVLDAKVPMILERNFKAGGPVYINSKDLTNVLDTAESIGMKLPLSGQVLDMYQELLRDGKKDIDHCGLVQVYEKRENIEVKKVSHDDKL
ncbi:2-hydroxy-3-oxopropionate reductase [bacterium LRH843]|nr:2-hydroxy-3-oxopropionate reductase [bacterium LRH843]